jgi:hypothetical protein
MASHAAGLHVLNQPQAARQPYSETQQSSPASGGLPLLPLARATRTILRRYGDGRSYFCQISSVLRSGGGRITRPTVQARSPILSAPERSDL